MRRRPSHRPSRRGTVVAILVIGGLIASIVAGVFLIDRSTAGDLPGIALGSEGILVIERIAVLFATWLLGLVVVVRALVGELPIEISGRGVRYADAKASQDATSGSNDALRGLEEEMNVLRSIVFTMQDMQIDHDERLRRYAMRNENDGH